MRMLFGGRLNETFEGPYPNAEGMIILTFPPTLHFTIPN